MGLVNGEGHKGTGSLKKTPKRMGEERDLKKGFQDQK